MSAHLLDVNVLIALAWPQHVHHSAAHEWFKGARHEAWATCPVTQLAFVRISSNSKIIAEAVTPRQAHDLLKRIIALPGHEFWPDDVEPAAAATFSSTALVGHRQVSDAYLLALAMHHSGKVATFDGGVAELLPLQGRERHVTIIDASGHE